MAMLSIKDFPDDLYRFLKVKAAQEGKTLRSLVIELLKKVIKGKEG